jgi:methyl-CpG-binding domain protein 4
MFLNRTRGSQALPIMWKFLEEYPTPQKAVLADVHTLADLLRPLGLQLSIFIEVFILK